jgi:hypothetical protein
LPFLLDLSSKVEWYAKVAASAPPLSTLHGNHILWLASAHWGRSLTDFNANTLFLRMIALPQDSRPRVIQLISFILEGKNMKDLPETSKLPKEVMDRLAMSLAGLEASLLAKDPQMSQHLRNSHALLVSYPETVTLLNDAEIATLIAAAQSHTQVEIVKAAAKGKGKSASAVGKLTINDL